MLRCLNSSTTVACRCTELRQLPHSACELIHQLSEHQSEAERANKNMCFGLSYATVDGLHCAHFALASRLHLSASRCLASSVFSL